MSRYFEVEQMKDWIKIKHLSSLPFYCYLVYIDHQLVATYYGGDEFFLQTKYVRNPNYLFIVGYYNNYGIPTPIGEQYVFHANDETRARTRDFQPGDILVASDNINGALTGYIGHSAIVVDENQLIESPGGHPAIQKDSIQQFLDKHPQHAQFRPKQQELGKAAADYAEEYHDKYKENLQNGEEKPVFSYSLTVSLEEPWDHIYCSKLVWISYFHGAGYEIKNDYLWFSPEDLYTQLKKSDDFETIYENEGVNFHINT